MKKSKMTPEEVSLGYSSRRTELIVKLAGGSRKGAQRRERGEKSSSSREESVRLAFGLERVV